MHVTPELRELLKKPTFDNWQWDDVEMLFLLQQMFLDLGLVRTFNLQVLWFVLFLLQLASFIINSGIMCIIFYSQSINRTSVIDGNLRI